MSRAPNSAPTADADAAGGAPHAARRVPRRRVLSRLLPTLDLTEPVLALIYGIAIIGAAFLLSWAAEAAQVDISAGLALAVLALLAVLPEYALDFTFLMGTKVPSIR